MNKRPTTNPIDQLFMLGQATMDWFVQPELAARPEESRRARLVVVSALSLSALSALLAAIVPWTPYVVVGGVPLPRPVVAALFLSMVVNAAIAFVVRRTSSAESAALLQAVGLLVLTSHLTYFTGGYDSPLLWWLVAIPLFAALVGGPRGALQAALLSTATMLFFYTLDLNGHAFPSDRPSEVAAGKLRGQLSLLAFVTILGWYYERDRRQHTRSLTDAYARIESAHEAVVFSQEHVRQIAEHIGQALWMFDVGSERVVYANTGFETIFDLPRKHLVDDPRAWVVRVHPEDLDLLPQETDGLDHVYRIIGHDGSERWLRHAAYPVKGPGDRIERVIHIAADITLKQQADALRERFLETVLEVQETERKHLARELHDETGQSLTALLVGLRALDGAISDKAQRDHIGVLRTQLRSVINDIGRLARGLHPAVLDAHGLAAAMMRLAGDLSEAYGIKVKVRLDGFDDTEADERVPRDVRLTVYRICQEALTNVVRHAQATQVDINLILDDDEVQLRVEDDGHGFVPAEHREREGEIGIGLGLLSMRERAALAGGEVVIESAPGAGTTVIVEIPLFRRQTTAEVRRQEI